MREGGSEGGSEEGSEGGSEGMREGHNECTSNEEASCNDLPLFSRYS